MDLLQECEALWTPYLWTSSPIHQTLLQEREELLSALLNDNNIPAVYGAVKTYHCDSCTKIVDVVKGKLPTAQARGMILECAPTFIEHQGTPCNKPLVD